MLSMIFFESLSQLHLRLGFQDYTNPYFDNTIKNIPLYLFHLYLFMQVVAMPVSTVLTVTLRVPQTVKTARVTYMLDHVLIVNLGGLECNAIQVR